MKTKVSFVTACVGLLVALAPSVSALPEGDVHFQRALEYELQQNIEGAAAEFRRGLELDPGSVNGHINYGLLLLNEVGDVDGAISEFVTALAIDPQCTLCQTHLDEATALRNSKSEVDVARGNNFYRTGHLARATALFRIACYVDPKNAEAHNSLAWTLYRLGNLQEAKKEVLAALAIRPDDAEYINTLACVLLDEGDVKGAIEKFQLAINKSTKANPADLYGLAMAMLSTGEKEKAIDNFKRAIDSDPNFADAKYIRDKIGMSVRSVAAHDVLLTLSGAKESKLPAGK